MYAGYIGTMCISSSCFSFRCAIIRLDFANYVDRVKTYSIFFSYLI